MNRPNISFVEKITINAKVHALTQIQN